jgi:hypothetical protein
MNDQTLALEKTILSRGGNLHKNEKRDRVMRVRDWTVKKLGEFGTADNDRDDVIFMLLQDHEELQFLKEWLREKKIKPPVFKSELEEDKKEE